jgi:hypothetical protein
MNQNRLPQLAAKSGCHWLRQCFLALALLSWLTILAGCPKQIPPAGNEAADTTPANTRASVTLRLLVVNDPPLVEALNRLRGEWSERSGGELATTGATWKELAEAKTLDADAVIFPSRYLGEFCTRGWLRPVRSSILESDDVKATDFFPTVRNALIKWGNQTMALPLGVDPSVLSPTAASAPKSVMLAALAAPIAVSKERIGVWFETETLKPRIAEPAFAVALEQIRSAGRDNRQVLSKGQQSIPVIGYNDRLVAVTNSTHNAASAFRLIAWLAQPEASSQLARIGNAQLAARKSLASSANWYDTDLSSTDRADRGKALDDLLSAEQFILVPRIPGVDDYLAALDEVIEPATDATSATKALQQAAEKWEKITHSRDRTAQQNAYLKSLNLAEK